MNDMVKTGFFLFVTCIIAAVALAFTEQITSGPIAANKKLALAEAQRQVLPAAARFAERAVPEAAARASTPVVSVAVAVGSAGEPLGFVVETAPRGYGGPISLIVGLKPDATINGVAVGGMSETPGLGTKLKEPDFLGRFEAKVKAKGAALVLKVTKDGGDVDAITAATISSRAFCRGVKQAVDLVRDHGATLAAAPVASASGGAQ